MSEDITPTIPNRIPQLTPATKATDAALAPVSPTGSPWLPQVAVRVATGLVALAGFVLALSLPPVSVALPPIVVSICTAVMGLGVLFGISSQGVRSEPPKA